MGPAVVQEVANPIVPKPAAKPGQEVPTASPPAPGHPTPVAEVIPPPVKDPEAPVDEDIQLVDDVSASPPKKVRKVDPESEASNSLKSAWRELCEAAKATVLREDFPDFSCAVNSLTRFGLPYVRDAVRAAFPKLAASKLKKTDDDDDEVAADASGFPSMKSMFRTVGESDAVPEVHGLAVNSLAAIAPAIVAIARAHARFAWVMAKRQRFGFVSNNRSGVPANIYVWELLEEEHRAFPLSTERPFPSQLDFTRIFSLWRIARSLYEVSTTEWPRMIRPFIEIMTGIVIKSSIASKSGRIIDLPQWIITWQNRRPPPVAPNQDKSQPPTDPDADKTSSTKESLQGQSFRSDSFGSAYRAYGRGRGRGNRNRRF